MIITIEDIMAIEKEKLSERAVMLQQEEIARLVEWLALKEDDSRYQAFLLLQAKSRSDSGVYSYS